MAEQQPQRWDLSAYGHGHRVEIEGSVSRSIRWYVDDRLVARKRSSDDSVQLRPGDGADPDGPTGTDAAERSEREDLGAVGVKFTSLGRAKRVTLYRAEGEISASARALLGTGGIDLDPEPGSPAALREERIRRHPRRHAAVATLGGVAKVVVPLVLGLLAVRFAVSIPWPDWDLPRIPWPDLDLPSIPWPDWDLPSIPWPDLQVPAWVSWVAERLKYVWPVVLALVLARAEIRRRRQQDALKARLRAEAAAGGTRSDAWADAAGTGTQADPEPSVEPSADGSGHRPDTAPGSGSGSRPG